METLGKRLKHAIDSAGLSQNAAAKRAHLSGATISDWCNGKVKEYKAETLEQICSSLHLSQKWLLHGKGEMREMGRQPTKEEKSEFLRMDPQVDEIVKLSHYLTKAQKTDLIAKIKETVKHNSAVLAELSGILEKPDY